VVFCADGLVALAQVRGLGADDQPAAARHGVAGVDDQVHKHLIDLAGVRPDVAQPRPQGDLQPDALAEHAAEHVLGLGHQGVEVQHPRGDDLLAAEGQ
jgi:hypothetical protein